MIATKILQSRKPGCGSLSSLIKRKPPRWRGLIRIRKAKSRTRVYFTAEFLKRCRRRNSPSPPPPPPPKHTARFGAMVPSNETTATRYRAPYLNAPGDRSGSWPGKPLLTMNPSNSASHSYGVRESQTRGWSGCAGRLGQRAAAQCCDRDERACVTEAQERSELTNRT